MRTEWIGRYIMEMLAFLLGIVIVITYAKGMKAVLLPLFLCVGGMALYAEWRAHIGRRRVFAMISVVITYGVLYYVLRSLLPMLSSFA